MTFWGFGILDLAVMLGFVITLLYIGTRASKRIKSQEDFFLAAVSASGHENGFASAKAE